VPIAVLLAEPALAASPEPALPVEQAVVVLPPRCTAPSFSTALFLDSLRVELAGSGPWCCALGDANDWPPTEAAIRVKVDLVPCVADADRVRVSVFEREVSLAEVAQTARPRALALAVAELIHSLGQGERSKATAAAASAAPVPKTGPPEVARPAGSARFSIRVEAEARIFPANDTTTWGGRVRLTTHWRVLHADLDLGGDLGRKQVVLGNLLLRSAGAGLTLGPRFATRVAIIDIGLRGELGWAWIRGETALASVHARAGSDLISSVGFQLSLEAPAKPRIRPSITLEGGGFVRGLNGEVNGQTVTGITGCYLLAALGFAVSL
jgi:hypothetical protein